MNRTIVWILGDQLSDAWPDWLAARGLHPGNAELLLIESAAKLRSRTWHRHKLILVLSAMRHFAEELHALGWRVTYRRAASFESGLREHLDAVRATRLFVMRPATWQGAQFADALVDRLAPVAVETLPNAMFLATPADLGTARSPLMESFYRKLRMRTGLLMQSGAPVGGAWNFDADNRQPPRKAWRAGDTRDAPTPPMCAPDDVVRAVTEEVRALPTAWGPADGFALPVTRAGALVLLRDFLAQRLPHFGPYEDAMVSGQPVLSHSLLSPLLNIGLLAPLAVCAAAVAEHDAGRAPLNSVEGFVRQIIGWREFVYARYWREMPGLREANALNAQRPLPAIYWQPDDASTPLREMACLRESVQGVWARGYAHHIQRLMVLSNWALLSGVRPQELNEWFLCTFIDAYDWVVTPNVIGMGTYGDGGVVGTKPYAAGGNYLHKMGTYCEGCAFDPKQRVGPRACPFNALYWDFIARHADLLARNPRTAMPVRALRKMKPEDVAALRAQARKWGG